ncbi:MAG: hypothetical protein PHS17_08300 [Desulfobacterales bacterium]|nr:hypothetical protein [Desulfobacterales bacterium]
MKLLAGADYKTAGVKNSIVHGGKLIKCQPGHINKLYDGCALVAFDLPIVIRVRGEQSLYFNVKDKGIVCVTGCCHQTILTPRNHCLFTCRKRRQVKRQILRLLLCVLRALAVHSYRSSVLDLAIHKGVNTMTCKRKKE